MEQAQKLLKTQQPTVLKDPFPQEQNEAFALKDVKGIASASTNHNYINMVWSITFLQTRNKKFESEARDKGNSTAKTSTPLTIEKSGEPMPKILKGVFKKTFHNPNTRASSNYSVVEDLAQNPCVMSTLEVLHIFPSQRDVHLAAIGSTDWVSLLEKFNLSDVKMCLPYHLTL